MKRALLPILWTFLLSSSVMAYDSSRWSKSTEIYTRSGETYLTGELFGNTYTGIINPSNCSVPNQWCIINLSANDIDNDAKSAFIQGLLTLTRGSTDETADLTLAFRRPGDSNVSCNHYVGQAVISLFTGERTNFATWVPVVNRQFEFCWKKSTGGNWPANTSYGWNIGLQAWVK